MIIDDLKKAIKIMLHPGSVSETMSVGKALKFYYSVSIIPLIISLILAAVFLATPLSTGSGAGSASLLFILILYLIVILAFIPLNLLFYAAIYQLFAKKLFHMWSKPYNNTFTGMVYGALPMLLLIWLVTIPFPWSIIYIVAIIWSIIVLIISMARQQSISGAMAFLGMFVSSLIFDVIVAVIVGIIILLIGAMFLGTLLGGILSQSITGSHAIGAAPSLFPTGLQTSIPQHISQPSIPTTAATLANVTPVDNYSYKGMFNGAEVSLISVQGKTIEALPDASLVGTLYNFSTSNPKYSCLGGSALNVWIAPSEYPGYYVIHNGGQGSQCAYITMVIPKSEMTAPTT
jgi:hypothetical protein